MPHGHFRFVPSRCQPVSLHDGRLPLQGDGNLSPRLPRPSAATAAMVGIGTLWFLSAEGSLQLSSETLPTIDAAPPLEFGGPGGKWSPETLLTSAAAACFILSFRAVAAASKFEYTSIECETEGELDRVEKITRFTRLKTHAPLTVHDQATKEKAIKLLEKAESICLIANSLNVERELFCEVIVS